MPSTGEARAAQARRRRQREAKEQADFRADYDRRGARIAQLEGEVADRDEQIERLRAALVQLSAERAGQGAFLAAANDGVESPRGPMAQMIDVLEGSCDQCSRLAHYLRVFEEKATRVERDLDAEKVAHAATRKQRADELEQRDARVRELEHKMKHLIMPPWFGAGV